MESLPTPLSPEKNSIESLFIRVNELITELDTLCRERAQCTPWDRQQTQYSRKYLSMKKRIDTIVEYIQKQINQSHQQSRSKELRHVLTWSRSTHNAAKNIEACKTYYAIICEELHQLHKQAIITKQQQRKKR